MFYSLEALYFKNIRKILIIGKNRKITRKLNFLNSGFYYMNKKQKSEYLLKPKQHHCVIITS